MRKLGKQPNGIYRLTHNDTPTNEYAIVLDAGDGNYICYVIQSDYKLGRNSFTFNLGTKITYPERAIDRFTYIISIPDWINAGHPKFVTARELITWDLKEIEKQKYIIVKDCECEN